jgi:hypothetical protein
MKKNVLIVITFLYTTILYSQIVFFDSKTQLYGVLNYSGKIILNPKYEYMTAFQFGISRFEENDKWGIIDTNGKVIIKAQFDLCSFNRLGFNEELISVNYNDKYGFFNLKGEMVIPFKFDLATDFCGGIAFIEQDDKINFINKNGNYLSEIWFDDVKIVNGVNYGFRDGKYYSVNLDEIKVCENQEYVANYGTYYIPYCDNLRIDINRKPTILSSFYDPDLKLFGYKNKSSNEVIIKPIYKKTTYFSDGFALVMLDEEKVLAIIDESGKLISKIDKEYTYTWDEYDNEPWGFKKGFITLQSVQLINGENVIKNFIFNTKGMLIIEGSAADTISFGEGGDC